MTRKTNNQAQHFNSILQKRLSRRQFVTASSATTGAILFSSAQAYGEKTPRKATQSPSLLSFKELPHALDEYLSVAEGYEAQVLVAWGDPLFANVPEFDPRVQSEASQLQRFGYNNDFVGYLPLAFNSGNSQRGLLVVNHESTNPQLMFQQISRLGDLSLEQTRIDIAAHGMSVIEVEKTTKGWRSVLNSKYNRRITPNTPMRISGPAAGSERLRNVNSADGVATLGTCGNCAGGVTPWGTVLSGEENVDLFFSGNPRLPSEARSFASFSTHGGGNSWARHFSRWDLEKNPRELFHLGWIVEVDPFDPKSTPKKRSALGRFKHEGANTYINLDNRIVVYMGDDEANQFIYRFVSRNKFKHGDTAANKNLLDEGELSVARFDENGNLEWLPLVYGRGPLNKKAGFNSQADVVIDARIAATLLGATPMDRPEDVDVNPVNGHVYAMLTNNSSRQTTNSVNPRKNNRDGHIIEFWPADGNHASSVFKWDLFLVAGEPKTGSTLYHSQISKNGWLSCPDNCAFDSQGNIWIATDGAPRRGVADGIWAAEVDGTEKGLTKRFLRAPLGAEICGPFFTPDDETLFCAIQHPAAGSSFNNPATRWPDYDSGLPPRPAVVAITKKGGGRIGS